MKVSDFDFDLPDSAIALRPASPRDHARLLQVRADGEFSDHHVYDLPDLLKAGDVLVLNETKVLPASLSGERPARAHGGGGPVEIQINLHKRISDDTWRAFCRPAKRLKPGDHIKFSNQLQAEVKRKFDGGDTELEFNLSGSALERAIDETGRPPLPPYIERQRCWDRQDVSDYQTVYAKDSGSVAAPTAGLHFTDRLLEALTDKGVQFERLTLHVGAGTFLPVKTERIDAHVMHAEWYAIDPETAARLNAAKQEQRRIICVGTTSLRALESSAANGRVEKLSADTDIFITPGYEFQIADGMMTNFHLPKSTLFMLVSAMCGRERMISAYGHALESGYRFYSYGDSSLLWAAK